MADKAPRNKGLLPMRYVFAVLGSVLFAILYGYKSNLSVAIVAMVNHTAIRRAAAQHAGPGANNESRPLQGVCDFEEEAEVLEDGPFDWNEPVQGLILGSYFWGYLVSQLPAGRMAERFSAKWVLFASALLNIAGCLLIPPLSYLHYSGLLLLRVVQGIGGGLSFPAMHVMIAKWAPPQERSVVSAIVYAGMALGTVISLLMTGAISAALNWEAVFYIMGSLSLVWCVLWAWLMDDSPETSRFIGEEERNHITKSLGENVASEHSSLPVPWRSIFTSMPFLAILVAHFCSNFGWYMLLIELPTYMNTILKFKINANALLSSMPFLVMWFFSIALSKCLDVAREKKYISTTAARKIATGFASLVPCACLVGVSFAGCDRTAAVALMTVGTMTLGGMFSGFLSNHIDIAPNFAGTLIGITNTVATIPGFLVPVLVGQLTHGNQTIGQWRIIFLITAGLFLAEAVFYTVFGSGVVQPWNNPNNPEVAAANGKKGEASDERERASP
ncbi:sialin-like isoform X2 [Bacillus rossius redtenbacheri]|uniref:sialin-like isoform X2 n=1 Tax=Bacillus rossius redtenbacheri TaxID=93214 RepID=UPI002FDDDE15